MQTTNHKPTVPQRLLKVLMHPSGFTFLLTNLVMLIGLLFLGWDGPTIVAAYFMETIIIGVFNVLKLLMIYFLNPNREDAANQSSIKGLVTVPFFIGFYGLFIAVQLVVFIGIQNFGAGLGFPNPVAYFHANLGIHATAIIGNFIIGQLIIFTTVFFAQKRYQTVSLQRQMFSPFSRLFVQQVVVIVSGFIIQHYSGSNTPAILLIVFKTMIDLAMQNVELNKAIAQANEAPGI